MRLKSLFLNSVLVLPLIFLIACSTQRVNPSKSHHFGNKFRNVHPYDPPGFSDFLKWRWEAFWKEIPGKDDYDFKHAKYDITIPLILKRSAKDLVDFIWPQFLSARMSPGGSSKRITFLQRKRSRCIRMSGQSSRSAFTGGHLF